MFAELKVDLALLDSCLQRRRRLRLLCSEIDQRLSSPVKSFQLQSTLRTFSRCRIFFQIDEILPQLQLQRLDLCIQMDRCPLVSGFGR